MRLSLTWSWRARARFWIDPARARSIESRAAAAASASVGCEFQNVVPHSCASSMVKLSWLSLYISRAVAATAELGPCQLSSFSNRSTEAVSRSSIEIQRVGLDVVVGRIRMSCQCEPATDVIGVVLEGGCVGGAGVALSPATIGRCGGAVAVTV